MAILFISVLSLKSEVTKTEKHLEADVKIPNTN